MYILNTLVTNTQTRRANIKHFGYTREARRMAAHDCDVRYTAIRATLNHRIQRHP